jgi:hypothetical protein
VEFVNWVKGPNQSLEGTPSCVQTMTCFGWCFSVYVKEGLKLGSTTAAKFTKKVLKKKSGEGAPLLLTIKIDFWGKRRCNLFAR